VAERGDLIDFIDDDDFLEGGDSGFGVFASPTGSFMPIGSGGLFGSVFKFAKSAGSKLLGALKKGGSSKVAKAARKIAANPTVRAVGTAAGGAAVGEVLTRASIPVPRTGGGLLPMPGGGAMMRSGGGGGSRGPSIIVDSTGVAWRRAGRPVLWSGDLTAVRRVNKAASRARRASGSRRSLRR